MDEQGETEPANSFNAESIDVNALILKFRSGGGVEDDLCQFWTKKACQTLSPSFESESFDHLNRDENIYDDVMKPLENFICDFEQNDLRSHLASISGSSAVCGKLFGNGDPSYSCRECATDATCVLCAECFTNSIHKTHKYKMSSSGGGGCCDCGDSEAWKLGSHCDNHKCDPDETLSIPEEYLKRSKVVIDAILYFAYKTMPSSLKEGFCSANSGGNDCKCVPAARKYCTVLYNDEVHTFDEVIQTLVVVFNGPRKDTTQYVTFIDKQGRAVMKCSTYKLCELLKSTIETCSSLHSALPLRVSVEKTCLIASQHLLLKLLSWLESILKLSSSLREIFCASMVSKPVSSGKNYLDHILTRSSKLWKLARLGWNRLLITGMLTDYKSKHTFGLAYTKNYSAILKDYIYDDHDRSYSAAALSVQVFTVPSLVHFLIEHENALEILLRAFLRQASKNMKAIDGKFKFEPKALSSRYFKRSTSSLHDLSYILSFVPDQINDATREKFIKSFSNFVRFLNGMEGMNCIRRQFGQHLEYEPEWKSGFSLHSNLLPLISNLLVWCNSDKTILTECLKKLVSKLQVEYKNKKMINLGDHGSCVIDYDISFRPVCIHLPVTRFLAGLVVGLQKFDLKLEEYIDNPVHLIEPVLQTRAMIAQVKAGMWRRNGFSLVQQIDLYNNLPYRTQMLDKDIIILQLGASLMQSDDFILNLIHKFNLYDWMKRKVKYIEDSSAGPIVGLVEDFLLILIIIIAERYAPGVGQVSEEECLKHEIIQHLCAQPLSHSELNKKLPHNACDETGLEDVIHELAVFKKTSKGSFYELKPGFNKEYNAFFYHFTPEQFLKAEEKQKKQNKVKLGFECSPPPVLPAFTETFKTVNNILCCDLMIFVLKLLLERSVTSSTRNVSESLINKLLYLIALGLQEEEAGRLTEKFSQKTSSFIVLIENILKSPLGEGNNELIKYVLSKYAVLTDEVASVAMSYSYSNAAEEKEIRSKQASERKAKIMAQMAAMQKKFMKANSHFFNESNESCQKTVAPDEAMEVAVSSHVSLGPNQTQTQVQTTSHVCILCQGEQNVTAGGRSLVLAAFLQHSTVLSRTNGLDTPPPKKKKNSSAPPSNSLSLHTSSCGHVMHRECWKRYLKTSVDELRHTFGLTDLDRKEYLCPLCECLSNTLVPLLPSLSSFSNLKSFNDDSQSMSFNKWIENATEWTASLHKSACSSSERSGMRTRSKSVIDALKEKALKESSSSSAASIASAAFDDLAKLLSYPLTGSPSTNDLSTIFNSDSPLSDLKAIKLFVTEPYLSDDVIKSILHYVKATCVRRHISYTKPFGSLAAWKSCAYSIRSLEHSLRLSNDPLFGQMSNRQRACLEALSRLSAILGTAWRNDSDVRQFVGEILKVLLGNKDSLFIITTWCTFTTLVVLISCLPCMVSSPWVPTGSSFELQAFTLVLYYSIAQIMYVMDLSEENYKSASNSLETSCLHRLMQQLHPKAEDLSSDLIWEQIKSKSMPFLRCSALFFSSLSDVPPSEELTQPGGDTFENLCSYLGIPSSCSQLLDNEQFSILLSKWVTTWRAFDGSSQEIKSIFYTHLQPVRGLVSLPEDYSDLMNSLARYSCPKKKVSDARNHSMCLICGEIMCSQAYCCLGKIKDVNKMVGASMCHTEKCGGGVGIFIRIGDCEVVMLATPNRGKYLTPPYVDEYGEPDPGLLRGNPLRLCHERYNQLQNYWFTHSIHREIARNLSSHTALDFGISGPPPHWQSF